MIGFPLVISVSERDMPGIEPGPLGWHTSTLTNEVQALVWDKGGPSKLLVLTKVVFSLSVPHQHERKRFGIMSGGGEIFESFSDQIG